MQVRTSIVIPTLQAGRYLPALLAAFDAQPGAEETEILLVDSASEDETPALAAAHPRTRLVPIAREAFTHGYARNLGVRHAAGEIVIFLSQDALPLGNAWQAGMLAPFADPAVGAAFCRQVPHPDANPIEQTFIAYWFPERNRTTHGAAENGRNLRFGDVFFSNVCSAARLALLRAHPFDERIIMSEDQQFARDILQAGHDLVYTADVAVRHSHHYSLRQIFQRYFDSAYSLTCIFNHTLSESLQAGRGYLPHEAGTIVTRHPAWIPYYAAYFLAKGMGVFAGHLAPHMPRRWARACSLHKRFWDGPWQHRQPEDRP
jgi:rhamnosyltransferase